MSDLTREVPVVRPALTDGCDLKEYFSGVYQREDMGADPERLEVWIVGPTLWGQTVSDLVCRGSGE